MLVNLLPKLPGLERIDSPDGRTYRTPSGLIYPSASTIVGYSEDKTHLDAWREQVGDKVADDISKRATDRGTLIHENIENFILGKPEKFSMFHQTERQMYKNVMPFINGLEEVYCLETQMWTDTFKAAGTVDMVAQHNGSLKVIDWKTSSRFKTREDIPGYFTQGAAYAAMVYERYQMQCPTIAIVITTQDDGLLVYEERTTKWLPRFADARKKYLEDKGI